MVVGRWWIPFSEGNILLSFSEYIVKLNDASLDCLVRHDAGGKINSEFGEDICIIHQAIALVEAKSERNDAQTTWIPM